MRDRDLGRAVSRAIEEMRFFEQGKQRAIDDAVEVRKREEAAKLEKAKRAEADRSLSQFHHS